MAFPTDGPCTAASPTHSSAVHLAPPPHQATLAHLGKPWHCAKGFKGKRPVPVLGPRLETPISCLLNLSAQKREARPRLALEHQICK